MTSTKDEASNDLHQAIELERLSRVAGDDANKLVTTQVAGQLLNVDSRLSTEIVHRVEGDLGNLKELNSIAAALNKYKVELGSELTNESISRDHLGIELSNSISSATAYFDHSTFLLYQAIQTAQDEYRRSNESMDARIKKYENMLQDITTDSIQITTDNGELRMGVWTILSQARQWDLDIMSKLGTLETKTTEDLNQALQELQDKLPIEQDIIDKAIEQLSNAPIIKELDELLGSSIERIEDMDLALVNEAKERASQMLALAQQQIDASKELAALIKSEIEEEHAYLIEAQVKEATIRAAEIEDKAYSLRVEVDQALTSLDTHVSTNIDKVSQLTEDLRLALIQENKDRLAAIALLDDGLTAEIKQRKDGDTASIQAINNYKSSNDTALANVRESISTVATNNSANAQRISALDSRLGTAEQSVANATSTAESAVTATTALASQVDALSAMITDIEEGVETTVDVYAFNALKIRVDSAEGNIKTNTTNITTLTGTVKNLGTITSATNEAVSTLQTKQEITDGKVSQASSDITLLKNSVATVEAELDTKVDSLAYAGLESTVSKQGTAIDSQSKDIVSLKDSVTTITGNLSKKAESSALTALTNRVTTAEGSVKSHGESITALNNSLTTVNGELAKKATSAAVASLTSTVNDTKGELSTLSKSVQSLTGELDTVEQDLATKASVSALDATTAEVKTIKGNVTTNTDKISVLQNDIQVVNNGLSTKLDAGAITNYYTKGQADNKAAEIAAGEVSKYNASLVIGGVNLLKTAELTNGDVLNRVASTHTFVDDPTCPSGNTNVTKVTTTGGTGGIYVGAGTASNNNKDEVFTASVWLKGERGGENVYILEGNTPIPADSNSFNITTEWKRYSCQVKRNNDASFSFVVYCTTGAGSVFYASRIQYEKGTKMTAWSHPQQVLNDAVNANATAISKTDARVTQVDGKVTAHTSQISKLNSDVVSINGALATKANSSALQGLASEATVNASIAAATTALNASLGSSGTNIFKTDMANVKEGYMEASRLGNSDLSYWSVVDATDAASGKALQYSPKGQPINTYTELSPLNKTVDPNGYGSFNLKSNTHYLFSCYVTLVKAPTSGMFSFGFSLKYQAEGTAVEYVRQLKASVITAADLGKRVRVTVVIKTPERLHEERRAVPYIHSNMSRVADGTVLMDSFMLEEILNYDDKATHKPSSFDSVGYETFQAVTANANALDVLKTNVSDVDGKVTSVGNRTTSLENSVNNATTGLNTKASSSALNTLDNRVGVVDGKVTTTSNNLTQLTGRVSTVEKGLTSKADVSALSDIYTKSQADAKAAEISAGKVEEFKAGLSIGGVNRILNSEAERTTPNSEYLLYERSAYLKDLYEEFLGKEVTISFDLKVAVAGGVTVYCSNSTFHSFTTSVTVPAADVNKWVRRSVVVTPKRHPTNTTATMSGLEFYGTYDTGRIPYVRKVQLELGNVATDWSPNPADTAATLGSTGTNLFKADMANVRDDTVALARLGNTDVAYWSVVTEAEAASGKAIKYAPLTQPANTYTEFTPVNKNANFANYGTVSLKPATYYMFSFYARLITNPSSGVFTFGFTLNYQSDAGTSDWLRHIANRGNLSLSSADLGKRVRIYGIIKTTSRTEDAKRAIAFIHTNMSRVSSGVVNIDSFMLEELRGYKDGVQSQPSSFDSSGYEAFDSASATASAVEHLTSQVTEVQGTLTSVSGRTTNLENAINNTTNGLASKASSQAFTTLNNQVQHSTSGLSAINTKVDSLKATIENTTNGLASKASSGALDTLANKVNHSTSGLEAIANKTTLLESEISYASAKKSFILAANRNGGSTTGFMGRGIYDEKKSRLAALTRGLNLIVWSADGSMQSCTQYDTYAGAAACVSLAAAIDALAANTYFTVIGVDNVGTAITTHAALRSSIVNNGGSDSYFDQWKGNYLPIFTSKKGMASGAAIQHSFNSSVTNDWIHYLLEFVAGIPVGLAGATPIDESKFATASAVESLTTRVSTAEGRITTEAGKVTTLQTEVAGNKAAISVQGTSINGIKAEYTIKTDVNGLVSGIGLINDGKSAAIGMNADYFYIGKPSNGKKPFMVTTSTQTINGVSYPAGTWIDVALIANATIGNAHIADASITNAKIKELDASKITTGTLDAKRIRVGSGTAFDAGFNPSANLQEAKSYVDAVEVGGTNLINGTALPSVTSRYLSTGIQTITRTATTDASKDIYPANISTVPVAIEAGEYTLSFYAKADKALGINSYFYNLNNTTKAVASNGTTSTGSNGVIEFNLTTEWQKYWVTWTTGAADTKNIVLGRLQGNNIGTVQFAMVKFEKGNRATDWTPSSADVEGNISEAKSLADSKSKTFTAQPTIPYKAGDIWRNGSAIYVCTNSRASGSYTSADWILVGDVTSANTAANSNQLGGKASSVVLNDITGAKNAADAAASKANSAETQLALWKYPNTTEIDGGKIRTNSVTANQISVANLSSLSANLGTIKVGTANIADLAVKTAQIDNSAITTAKIGDAQITTAKIGNLQVDTLKIKDDAVTVSSAASANGTTVSVTVVTSGGKVRIEGASYYEISGIQYNSVLNCVLYRNNVELHTWKLDSSGGAYLGDPESSTISYWFYGDRALPIFVDTPPAGTHVYKIVANRSLRSSIGVMEVKK